MNYVEKIGGSFLQKVLLFLCLAGLSILCSGTSHAHSDLIEYDRMFLQDFCRLVFTELQDQSVGIENVFQTSPGQMYHDCIYDIENLSYVKKTARSVSLEGLIPMDTEARTLAEQYISYAFEVEDRGMGLSLTRFHFSEIQGFEMVSKVIDLVGDGLVGVRIDLFQADGRSVIRSPDF